MILFENKENAQLIRQYLNQDILFEDCGIALDAFPAYERFDGEFRKVPTDRQSNVLAQLMVGYELHPAMKTILKNTNHLRTSNLIPVWMRIFKGCSTY